MNKTLTKFKEGFKELENYMIDDDYIRTKKRLIIIDQDGVMPMKEQGIMVKEPCHKCLDILNELAKDPNNYVLIFSNNTKEMMHSWYSEIAP